jgi:hypothetical protein
MFFSLVVMIMSRQQNVPELFDRRVIFYRERSAKCYGAIPYFFSSWIIEIPFVLFNIIVYTSTLYYMVGFSNQSGRFGVFFGQVFLNSLIGLFIAQFLAAASNSPMIAVGMYPAVLFLQMAFAGYIVFLPSLPSWLSCWGPYVSFLRFSFQTLCLNEFLDNSNLPYGESYIVTLGFDDYTKDQTSGVPVVFVIFFAISFFLALKFINYENR